jgi:putative MATE family efflux protein
LVFARAESLGKRRNMIMSKDEYLITDEPLKALTIFALPMILGSFFQQVYNMADSIIVGQFVGSSALAAVGACAALTNVFICVALGAGVGAGVLVSRYFGAGDYGKMKTIVSTSLVSFLILSLLLGGFGFCFSHSMMNLLQTPTDILEEAVQYLRIYFAGFPFLFMYNIFSTMFNSIGESKIPLGLLIFSSILNILMDLWMVAGLGLGVFGAALATLIAQGISAVFSFLIFFCRMRQYKSQFQWFDGQELHLMLKIAVPSILQQSTVSIGMMIVQAVVNPFGTQALAGYAATMRVENVFSLIFVSIGNAVSPYVSQNLGAKKINRIKKGYHAALVLDLCFAILAFVVIETMYTQISSLFLGKDGTDLAYQVSGDYMRWLGCFFIFMGIKMATDGVLRGLGIMRPFLIANIVNLAIRLFVAMIFAPCFGIAFVWLAVPAGWFANFLISYMALRKSWPVSTVCNSVANG